MTATAAAMTIIIEQEFEKLLPPLEQEEFEALKANVAESGVRDCLLAWRKGDKLILIDGHNRYRAWKELGKDPDQLPCIEMEFDDSDAVKDWMIANQLMRRNLTDERKAYYRGLVYQSARKSHGGKRESSGQSDQMTTAKALGEKYGVSEKTIRRNAKFAERVDALPDEQKEAVLSGVESLPKEEKPAAVMETISMDAIFTKMVTNTLFPTVRRFIDSAIHVISTAPCQLSEEDVTKLYEDGGINELIAAIKAKAISDIKHNNDETDCLESDESETESGGGELETDSDEEPGERRTTGDLEF